MEKNNIGLDALDQYLKQWRRLSGRLLGQLAPILETQKAMQNALRPFADLQKAIQSPFDAFLKEQERLKKILMGVTTPTFQFPDISPFTKQIEEYQKSLRSIVNPAFEEIQRAFKELPSKIQEAVLLLASHGWYLDLDMPLPGLWETKKALLSGEVAKVDEALVEYFEDQIGEIEKRIVSRFPGRAHILKAAFKAHRNGEYYLSIPVLLAQADGICKEVVDQYFFMKRRNDKRPKTAIYVEQIAADTYKAALLSPLATPAPIGASEHEREEGFGHLNRHTVLHGESLDYGTKVNSLKSVSLINYITQVLKDDEDA